MTLTLQRALQLLEATLAEGARQKAHPLGVVVLDAGGHPIASQRQNGASFFRLDIAKAKATGALGMGSDSRIIAERAAGNPAFFTSVAIATGGGLALSAGGVLVREHGAIVGAVGVSGDTPDMDEACAIAGILAADFIQGDTA